MKKERMKILEMVENGKISVDEAAKLLESIGMTTAENSEDFAYAIEEKFNSFAKNLDVFAKDINSKLNETYKGMEPKLKNATRTVVAKTACVFDDISKNLNESLKNAEKCDNTQSDCDQTQKKEDDDAPREN